MWTTLLLAMASTDVLRTTCGEVKHWYNHAGVQSCCVRQGGRPTDVVDIPLPPQEGATIVFEGKARPLPNVHTPHSVEWDVTNTTALVTVPDVFTLSAYLGRLATLDATLFFPRTPFIALHVASGRDTTGLVPQGLPFATFRH